MTMEDMSDAMNSHQIIENSKIETNIIKEEYVHKFKPGSEFSIDTYLPVKNTVNTFSELNIKKENNIDKKRGIELSVEENVQETHNEECKVTKINIKEEYVHKFKPGSEFSIDTYLPVKNTVNTFSELNIKKENNIDKKRGIELSVEENVQETHNEECKVTKINIKEEYVHKFKPGSEFSIDTYLPVKNTVNTFSELNIKKENIINEQEVIELSVEANLQEAHMECKFSEIKYTCISENNGENVLSELNIQKEKKEDVVYDGVLPFKSGSVVQLNSSEKSDEDSEFFICAVCSKNFMTKSSLKVHLRIHLGEKLFECEVCKKSFNILSNLRRHMRIHTGEKPYKCDVCKDSFTQNGKLVLHMRIHTGDKPYSCDMCTMSFPALNNLQRHVKNIHYGEKSFECGVCTKLFNTLENLRTHIKSHTGEKPYKCNVCMKSFIQKGKLLIHTRVHTGQKPYTCDACTKSFTTTGNLRRHLKIHAGEKLYKCDVCTKSFSVKSNLLRHMKTHN